MNYFLRISLVLFLFLTNKTYSQTVETETLEKSSFIISSSNENITSAQLNVYKTAVNNNTIMHGSKYLPVHFQLINWENGYAAHPIFDKFNELTY